MHLRGTDVIIHAEIFEEHRYVAERIKPNYRFVDMITHHVELSPELGHNISRTGNEGCGGIGSSHFAQWLTTRTLTVSSRARRSVLGLRARWAERLRRIE